MYVLFVWHKWSFEKSSASGFCKVSCSNCCVLSKYYFREFSKHFYLWPFLQLRLSFWFAAFSKGNVDLSILYGLDHWRQNIEKEKWRKKEKPWLALINTFLLIINIEKFYRREIKTFYILLKVDFQKLNFRWSILTGKQTKKISYFT